VVVAAPNESASARADAPNMEARTSLIMGSSPVVEPCSMSEERPEIRIVRGMVSDFLLTFDHEVFWVMK